MAEEPQQGNWSDATDRPVCPFCTNDRDLERRGKEWFCPCCSRCWLAFTRKDRIILKVLGIKADE